MVNTNIYNENMMFNLRKLEERHLFELAYNHSMQSESNANALVEFKSKIGLRTQGKPGPSVALFIVSYTLN